VVAVPGGTVNLRSCVLIALALASPARADEPTTPAAPPAPAAPTAPDTPTNPATPAAPATAPTPPAAPTTPATPPAPAAPTTPAATADADDDGEPRLSLPTEADRTAWQTSGFRLGLGFVYGRLVGLRGAPSGRLLGPTIRMGVRLDRSWSILASFQYASASASGELAGLRFAGTLDPTWHVTPRLALAFGFGFGGIVEGSTDRMDPEPAPSTLESSYTFPDASPPIASCSGVGAAGLVRIEWAYVLGPRGQTTIALEAVGQWTGCVDDTGRIEPDSGTAIVRRQWWPHTGATLAWGFTWR
jgi:hypothetical protein